MVRNAFYRATKYVDSSCRIGKTHVLGVAVAELMVVDSEAIEKVHCGECQDSRKPGSFY